jgi:Na+:H+ antiporter, NhaA family
VCDDVAAAETSGVSGTPTFFVNGRRHSGPYDTAGLAGSLTAPAEEAADRA